MPGQMLIWNKPITLKTDDSTCTIDKEADVTVIMFKVVCICALWDCLENYSCWVFVGCNWDNLGYTLLLNKLRILCKPFVCFNVNEGDWRWAKWLEGVSDCLVISWWQGLLATALTSRVRIFNILRLLQRHIQQTKKRDDLIRSLAQEYHFEGKTN